MRQWKMIWLCVGLVWWVSLSPAAASQRVFVSSTSSLGDLGGLQGADATCQQRADAAGLGGIWIAWLSDEGVDAVDRLSGNGPFVLVGSNETVAANKAEEGPRIVPAMKPMARTLVGMLMLLLGIWVYTGKTFWTSDALR